MLEDLSSRLRTIVERIKTRTYIDEKALNETIREIQKALILSDVNIRIVLDLTNRIKERFKGEKPPQGVSIKDYVIKLIYEELARILGKEKAELKIKNKPFKILLVGLEGSGKTTTAAKLARYFSNKGFRVGVFSTDIYRPAAVIQLEQLVSNISNVVFVKPDKKDIEDIINNAIKDLDNKVDIIIIDTAGRHKEEKYLIQEMKDIEKILNPDIIFLVIDATIGQRAYDQAKAFNEATNIGGIIVAKMDGTAKGGGALSAAVATGAKIYYIGTGEKIDDLEEYDPYSFVGRLLGIGDIKTILTRIESIVKESDIDKLKRISKGEFTLIDLLEQLEQIYKLGGFGKLLSYLPIFGRQIPKEKIDLLEKKVKLWRVAVNSMTLEEKMNPKIIKKSRLVRISRGSGVDERTIKELLRQYEMAKKMLRSQKHRRILKGYLRKLDL